MEMHFFAHAFAIYNKERLLKMAQLKINRL